jgi:hypothetical protein
MAAFDDLNLDHSSQWSSTPPVKHRPGVVVAVTLLALAAAAALGWWWLSREDAPAETAQIAAPGPIEAAAPLEARGPRESSLPPLGELDPTVRDLIRSLTSSSLVERWLATSNLTRQMAALVHGAAAGSTPLRFLAPLRPSGTFAVVDRQGGPVIAPATYARFDALTTVITSVDPATLAGAYRTLLPRLEDAHDELGTPERSFDGSLRRVLDQLVATPIPEGQIRVVPRGGVYAFEDPALERLSTVQKLLLRSGPENARRIQAQLIAFRDAIGVPPPTE